MGRRHPPAQGRAHDEARFPPSVTALRLEKVSTGRNCDAFAATRVDYRVERQLRETEAQA